MPVYKNEEKGNWYASFYYTDWMGKRKKKKKEEKDYREFTYERLPKRLQELEERGVFFRIPEAEVNIEKDNNSGRHKVTIQPFVANAKIYYTVDGHKADQTATLYSGPFLAPITGEGQEHLTLKYIIETPKGRTGNEFSVPIQ